MDSKWLWFAAFVVVAIYMSEKTSFFELALLTIVILVTASLLLGGGFLVAKFVPKRTAPPSPKVRTVKRK